MKRPERTLTLALTLVLAVLQAAGITPERIRWTDEGAEQHRIEMLLASAAAELPGGTAAEHLPLIATAMIGTPYVASTLESDDGTELLTIDLEGLDCTTFVETAAALALTAAEGRTHWQDFADRLESIRYRGGQIDGYGSRLHYISDWIIDNASRGNLVEVTSKFPTVDYAVRTLDYMTTHTSAYPAFALDSAALPAVRSVEQGYRNHRYPYIRSSLLRADRPTLRQLREGDIVAFTTSVKGLDVSHMGIITMVNGVPHVMHASSQSGQVEVSREPLGDYLHRRRSLTGIRVIRLL